MSDEKTEEPTEHKLEEARKEGQLAKSQDTVIAGSMLAVVATLLFMGDDVAQRMRAIVGQSLDLHAGELPLDEIYKRMATMALEAVRAIVPFTVAAALGAIVGAATHTGFEVSMKAVSPKLDSLDPAQGIKKVFSMKSLLSFGQMLLKAVVIGFVMWQVVLRLLPLISGAVFQSPDSIGAIAWSAVGKMLMFSVVLFVVLAPLDFALQKYLFLKGQRMSKDEVKRENKSQEGDPELKGKRKEIAHELAQESPRRAVARADALIVNPTHYAVAVRYRADEAGVPVVLAKGVDDAALRLRGLAAEQGVPIFAHPPLARALHAVQVDHAIPEELFEPVAVVLRWVDELGAQREGASDPNASAGTP